eukprot:TRINITY_DN76394_c0_g1_i1.p1 TRINITY_DN76394_c0_g1~~TRINITY_DN76394_c0_g1_i1.p1  ORF type:complete len:899 (-),score=115.15 TRINITY_DN76394_c0_g1_i1:56-2752(-)
MSSQRESYVALLDGSPPSTPRESLRDSTAEQRETDATAWIVDEASDSQVAKLVGIFLTERPGLLERLVSIDHHIEVTSDAPQEAVPLPSTSTASREANVKDQNNSQDNGVTKGAPVVQFSAAVYVGAEADGEVVIDILRLGDHSETSSVSWTTKDAAGKAGEIYEAAQGKAVFEPGQTTMPVVVKLVANPCWSAILDFSVELLEADLENAELGRYGKKCRVKVIDQDPFPSAEMGEVTNVENTQVSPMEVLERISKFKLVVDYCLMTFHSNPRVRAGTIKKIILDQLHNMYRLFKLYLRVYLVDHILRASNPDAKLAFHLDRYASLIAISAMWILPFGILHLLHYASLSWGIVSTSRVWIQTALMRTYLNYSNVSLAFIKPSDVTMSINYDAEFLAVNGYSNMLQFFSKLGTLVVLLAFQLTAPFIFNKPFRLTTMLAVLAMPLLNVLFLYFRAGLASWVLHRESKAQADLVLSVDYAVNNFRLIADYCKRGKIVDDFEDAAQVHSHSDREMKQVLANNLYFCKWLSTIIIALWSFFGGLKVVRGDLTLGLFLCDIQTFSTMGQVTQELFQIFISIQTALPSLERITLLLNLPTDLDMRMLVQRRCREYTALLRERVQKRNADDVRMDLLPIRLENVSCTYLAQDLKGHHLAKKKITITAQGQLSVDQGSLVALVGQLGSGKSTRLRVLGAATLPDAKCLDGFFIPSHLRVLHVEQPGFVEGTLMDNLTFGVETGDPDRLQGRVVEICRMLEVPDEIVDQISSDVHLDWQRILSVSERQKISLARAFIANPEVLILHRPFQVFDERSTEALADMLAEFVTGKGILQDSGGFRSRRPRTCIFSSATGKGLHCCTKIYRVTMQGVDEVSEQDAIETLGLKSVYRHSLRKSQIGVQNKVVN